MLLGKLVKPRVRRPTYCTLFGRVTSLPLSYTPHASLVPHHVFDVFRGFFTDFFPQILETTAILDLR